PQTTLLMQDLINAIRDIEDELTPGISNNKIADASGKDSLGGGVSTAITVRLLDNWRVRFEARPGPDTEQMTISGGNLVGGPLGNPIAPSAFTQVLNLSSASGTIATPSTASETTNLKYLLASAYNGQKTVGSIFYWDPVSGNDSNSGLAPSSAVATFTAAHTLATSGMHDVIFCLSSDPSGITTVTETLAITKNTLKVRGPGYTFQLIPTGTINDTIDITANNTEVSGLYISTAGSGTRNAVSVSADNVIVKDCWISQVQGHGITIADSNLCSIGINVIDNCGLSGTGNALNLGNNTTDTVIAKCIISDTKDGIALSGTGLSDNIVEDSLVYKNSGYGLTVGSGVLRTIARSGNTFVNNTSGNTQDLGTDTYIETTAGGASSSEIADAVWDEVISGHVTSGTAGRFLKDAKLKATIASLK
ncbi:MAG: right-handed parallel beta-helix repeat-containing protein, partial [Candidatus Roizmanbacteria bacterium]